MIDISPLAKAVDQLASAIHEQAHEPERPLLCAGLIHTFEYTFELTHKMLRRYLAAPEPSPDDVAALSYEGLIRRADELRLVSSPVALWKDFRQARTETSHTYNEAKAIGVVARIPAFYKEARFLVERLQEEIEAHG
ncbi:MAG: HI0074 family nucleotidyltransferase substrate-binding subunit [Janthinobacterium lividum]